MAKKFKVVVSIVKNGFIRFDNFDILKTLINGLLETDFYFFSSMKSKVDLGRIIEIANQEPTYELKGQKFLDLLRE